MDWETKPERTWHTLPSYQEEVVTLSRQSGKTMSLAMAYGGGKSKLLENLLNRDKEITKRIKEEVGIRNKQDKITLQIFSGLGN